MFSYVKQGDDVTVFGAGPVGYFAVMACFLRGAARVFSVDRINSWLRKTAELGAIPVNFELVDPVFVIREATQRKGTVCIDAVGYEATGHMMSPAVEKPSFPKENPSQVFNWIGNIARKYSTVGIPGVYQGLFDHFPIGRIFDLELQIHTGQCPVKAYNEPLLHMIEMGRIDPTPIISDIIGLEEPPQYYAKFNEKDGVTKVIIKPGR
jgi:S-(hydroxymethyl)glutathione dehydrogenase / alcohol dehydrogenase